MKVPVDDPTLSIAIAAARAQRVGAAPRPGEALITLQCDLVKELLIARGRAVCDLQAIGCAAYLAQVVASGFDADVGPTPDRCLDADDVAAMTICVGLNLLAVVGPAPLPEA